MTWSVGTICFPRDPNKSVASFKSHRTPKLRSLPPMLTSTKSTDSDGKTENPEVLSSVSSPDGEDTTRCRPKPAKKRPSTTQEVARQREWERKSRERRKENREKMNQQIKTLECALANIMFVTERTDVEGEIDDSESVIMRKFLRACVEYKDDINALNQEKDELRRKLLEYQRFESVVRLRLQGYSADDWPLREIKWRASTYATFTPWTQAQCQAVIDQVQEHMQTFSLRDDHVSSGLHFNGWRDQRRLDEQTSTLEFTFSKSYVAQDAQFISDEYYRIHQNGDEYNRVMLGPSVRIFYEVIQDVTPDMCIVRCVERYPDMPVNIHMLALIFRAQTATGYIQGVKSIPAGDLERATAEEDAVWASVFHLTSFDVLQRDHSGRCTAYKTSVSGSLSSVNAQFVHRWMVEAVVAVVRSESMLMGRRLLC